MLSFHTLSQTRLQLSVASICCIAVSHSATGNVRRESNDFLLPAMITFLNDRDWQLRAAFFHHICEMGSYAGSQGLQAFLLPCLEQVCCFPPSICTESSVTGASASLPALLLCTVAQQTLRNRLHNVMLPLPPCMKQNREAENGSSLRNH